MLHYTTTHIIISAKVSVQKFAYKKKKKNIKLASVRISIFLMHSLWLRTHFLAPTLPWILAMIRFILLAAGHNQYNRHWVLCLMVVYLLYLQTGTRPELMSFYRPRSFALNLWTVLRNFQNIDSFLTCGNVTKVPLTSETAGEITNFSKSSFVSQAVRYWHLFFVCSKLRIIHLR